MGVNRVRHLSLLVLPLALVFAGCTAPGQFVVKLSQQKVQQRINERFPVGARKLVFEVRLERPAVSFTPGGKIKIVLQVVGLVAGMPVGRASAAVTGKVHYAPERHEFHLTDPHVESLNLSHMPAAHAAHARRAVDNLVNNVMPAVPIYRLDPEQHRMARLLLRRAWICDNQLCLEMGL